MKLLLSICGRAGSKGVKNKNIREFDGYPLVLYTLSAYDLFVKRYSSLFEKIDISVNSDSEELLDIVSKSNICETIKRPQELGTDFVAKVDVMLYSLNEMEKLKKITYDYLIDCDITSPLRTVVDIKNLIEKTQLNKNFDTVLSVVPSRRNPYFNMVFENNNLIYKIKEGEFVARQQCPEAFDINGSMYCFTRKSLVNDKTIFKGDCGMYLMKDTGIIDIDKEDDFIFMEILAQNYFFKINEFKEIKDNISNLI